ncbi:GDSL-type esterase/lipase family protein [Pararcticibacter amylolyticus]|uniref:GDSL family lipase n=1 Tax=Pararcticibacter amylolyticus TaxID=2173175 RepID=A0A2U2PKS0_9SPHI|nr:GDSL-type esterase/lipase family protein [Pararcticibacter amylolyticus]PWG81759.1 GDSL family lipase [Pararcticibacter amylolyticus]
MKRLNILLALFSLPAFSAFSQEAKIDSNYTNSHYQQRMEFFNKMPHRKNEIVFLGNSITEHGEWQELIPGKPVINRGIGGDNTFGVLARLDDIVAAKPKTIFLLIGINDLSRKLPYDVIIRNYRRIIAKIKTGTPKTTLYIQSILPLNSSMTTAPYLQGRNPMQMELNRMIKELCAEEKLTYIDLHPLFEDENKELKKELSIDGIHLKASAYIMWVEYLKKMKYL